MGSRRHPAGDFLDPGEPQRGGPPLRLLQMLPLTRAPSPLCLCSQPRQTETSKPPLPWQPHADLLPSWPPFRLASLIGWISPSRRIPGRGPGERALGFSLLAGREGMKMSLSQEGRVTPAEERRSHAHQSVSSCGGGRGLRRENPALLQKRWFQSKRKLLRNRNSTASFSPYCLCLRRRLVTRVLL